MRTSFARALVVGSAATLLTTCLAAQAPPAARHRLGEVCPPGRWYTAGGNAARNAATTNPPLVHRPTLAWRQGVGGTILGEPLVWGEHVVLAVRPSPTRVAIEVRRLADGTLLGQRALNSTSDPGPSLWGNEIVWRVNTDGLELLRIGKKSVDFVTRMPAAKTVDVPLRLGTSVFAVVDGKITCMRAADFRVLWKSAANGFRGQLAIGDKVVYGTVSTGNARMAIAAYDRETGEPLGTSADVAVLERGADANRLQLAGATLFARFGDGSCFPEYRADVALNALEFRLPLLAANPLRPIAMPVARALDSRIHVGAIGMAGGTQLGMFPAGKDEGVRLDTCDLHRALAGVPPTIAGDVMYFGASAVDTTELRMLWRMHRTGDDVLPMTRAIPAGRTLLLAGDRTLFALRENAPADPIAAELAGVWLEQQRQRVTALVDAAVAALDWELAVDLLSRCRELEADESWAQKRDKEIAGKRKDSKKAPDATKAAAVRSAAELVGSAALDHVHGLVATWQDRPATEQRHGLRYVLAQSPDHAATAAAVRAMLPKELQPAEPFRGLDWLDFLDAAAHTDVAFLDATPAEFGEADLDAITAQSKQQLLEWRAKWRPDLQALSSKRLLLFSPITQPGSLAKALATGELVCDALESMFAAMPAVRQDPRPMLVFIYPDRSDYLAESKKLGIDAEWTAGYYSDSLNELVPKSRLFVPADDTGFATVLPTLAHELTHQWLRDRCPAFQPDPIASRVGPKAFWIVEGFASLVEQFEFDLARRQFRFGQGNLDRADLVASAKVTQLLDWSWLVGARRIDFDRLMANPTAVGIPSSVRLGGRFQTRGVDLFYAQAAMLARYLYDAEGGRFQKPLLGFVAAYYSGNSDALDFDKAFGISAKELGPKVAEYSRALVQ